MLDAKREFNKFCLSLTFGAMLIALNSAFADQLTNNAGGIVFFAECLSFAGFCVLWNLKERNQSDPRGCPDIRNWDESLVTEKTELRNPLQRS